MYDTTGGITLTLGNGAYSGCQVTAVNSAATAVTVVSGGSSFVINPGYALHLEFVSGKWVVAVDQAESFGALAAALDYAGLAARENQKTMKQRIQTGMVQITNRGVISGCAVTKSTNAVRNISLGAGAFFVQGQEIICPAFTNTSLVPPNNGTTAQTCYAYLYVDSDGRTVRFACTPFGGSVPEGGVALYRFTVPAGNTEVNDPYLAAVTMTDVRRMEPGFPVQFNAIAYASVSLPYSMIDADYEVVFDIIDFKGGVTQRPAVYAGNKAANGFRLYAEGTLDTVNIRWTALKMSL
jgi:hypothetical protein